MPVKKIYTVYTAGASVLKEKAQSLMFPLSPDIPRLAEEMYQALRAFDGIGLAAPQYGKNIRLVVFNVPEPEKGSFLSPGEALLLPEMPFAAVNPEIIEYGADQCENEEGCLSLPEIYGKVPRSATVKFRAQRLNGSAVECECGGLLARCIQHEIDHLDGILFVERMKSAEFYEIEPALRRLEHNGSNRGFKRKAKF